MTQENDKYKYKVYEFRGKIIFAKHLLDAENKAKKYGDVKVELII